jgi:O-succinylbenzoate synthase
VNQIIPIPIPIYIHRYTLHSGGPLNTRSVRNAHEGALIRVGDESFGYGCIHPWPELGDVDLEQTLGLLAAGESTDLSRRALTCAHEDGKARRAGINLFEGLVVPRSHATLTMDSSLFQAAVDAGFDIAKVKVGRDLEAESEFIRGQAACFPELRWRLDFNGSQGLDAVEKLLTSLGDDVRARVDFIEDAYLPNGSPWVDALGPYHIAMAVDREVESACGGFGVAVIKPAVNEVAPVLEQAAEHGRRVVITSYMDHPLGQCFAAWEAAKARASYPDLIDTCGLVTHGLFAPDAFSDSLGKPAPEFHPPAGTGLGFDELLQSLLWKRLI